ncbi:creatinase [Hasllibacter halocynthiae]|uniref:Creatinase n=1 Tax=Hasllibacter halocynthiae TaxID=595589 RepID=A0A2T0X9Y0_9RHOB|nr:aminopeptidase P family protein [Hasllibacter halocynthiae]PRY95739.1 creatinase [Hasllibacter halocynthiae]
MERERLQSYVGNGDKAVPTFSPGEMRRRQDVIRAHMAEADVDAVLFTSYQNIDYYADFLYCAFGRRYGLVIDHERATTISAGIDGGQPWRRTFGHNVTYTDWQKDNWFHAVRQLVGDARRIGIEFDEVDLDTYRLLQEEFPEVEFVDIAAAAMRLRMIKSPEEIERIAELARIADIGGAAVVEAVAPGVPEYEVALHSTQVMVREIARSYPHGELQDTWTWFQSGVNTDGAHNPVTTRRIEAGDILSLNCFPMSAGYYVALERTLFAGHCDDASRRLWELNCRVHDRGKELLVPGARCSEIARELNEIYAEADLLQYRSFGYGHSFGVLCHYYGREAGLELREDCETVLEPGMVVSMEPMITIPEGRPGAGGYREHDILVIEEGGSRNVTKFPYGPDHLVVKGKAEAA